MRILLPLFFLTVLNACKKNDAPIPIITFPDSTFQITSTVTSDINEVDISYVVKPPANTTFTNIYLSWSTSENFTAERDSAVIFVTNQSRVHRVVRLKQATKYFGRIGVDYNGRRYYSVVQNWTTDTLKIIDVGNNGAWRGLNKGDTTQTWTNFEPGGVPVNQMKILLGSIVCPIVEDAGMVTRFSVPESTPAGKYIFKIIRKGLEAQYKDSVEVLRCKWSLVTPPPPVNANSLFAGQLSFGTCYSNQKGYIFGGILLNGPAPYNSAGYILEFDAQQQIWTKRHPVSPRRFEYPIGYYHNNSIYVIGGHERLDNSSGMILKRMLRLDLATLTWFEMDTLPYPTLFNMTSFEMNNEWYIGMGADSANVTSCCGMPIPSKKFWKYNPANNQWTQLADFPGDHQNFPTSFSIGSKGYVFYGQIPIGDPITTTDFKQEFWEYNPQNNNWQSITLPPMGGPPIGEKYNIVSHNGKAYFLSCQQRSVGLGGYFFTGLQTGLEWDPINPLVYRYISFTKYPASILKTVYKNNNNFYFQTDALGYITDLPNRTYRLLVEEQ